MSGENSARAGRLQFLLRRKEIGRVKGDTRQLESAVPNRKPRWKRSEHKNLWIRREQLEGA